jgi:hypothetical protein
MSRISILGFTPVSSNDSVPPVHWSILVSPSTKIPSPATPTTDKTPKSRLFHFGQDEDASTPGTPVSESTLFDMHNHQLRQQPFPVPIPTPEATETDDAVPPKPLTTTTDITACLDRPYRLAVRVHLVENGNKPPSKIVAKVAPLLANDTPTYGPEDDWLRVALEELVYGNVLVEPTPQVVFEADAMVAVARDALDRAAFADHHLCECDYAAHLLANAQVKAMLSPPPGSSSSPAPSISSGRSGSVHSQRPTRKAGGRTGKKARFFGFWITPSPSSSGSNKGGGWAASSGGHTPYYSIGRQDNPYGGLM